MMSLATFYPSTRPFINTPTIPAPAPRVYAPSHAPAPIITSMITSLPNASSANEMTITPSQDAGRRLALSVVESLGLDDDDDEDGMVGVEGEYVNGVGMGGIRGRGGLPRQRVHRQGNDLPQPQHHSFTPFNGPTNTIPQPQQPFGGPRPHISSKIGHPTPRSRAFAAGRVGLLTNTNNSTSSSPAGGNLAPTSTGLGCPKTDWNVWGYEIDGGAGIGLPNLGSGSVAGSTSGSGTAGSLSGSASASEEDLIAGFEAYMRGIELSEQSSNLSTVYNSHPSTNTNKGPHPRPHVSTHNSSSSYATTSSGFESGSWNAAPGFASGLGNGSYQPEKLSYFAAGVVGRRGGSVSGRESLSSDEKDLKQVWEEKDRKTISRPVITTLSTKAEPFKFSPGQNTSLSAKAAPFTFKPREQAVEIEHLESATCSSPIEYNQQVYDHPHARASHNSRNGLPGRPRQPRGQEPIVPLGMRRISHGRSRSDVVHGNTVASQDQTTNCASGQVSLNGDEGQEVLLDSPLALLPAPRSKTPHPFKRPTYATQQQATPTSGGQTTDSLFHAGKRPGLPSLAEMGAKMRAKGAVYVPGQGGSGSGSPTRNSAPSSPVRSTMTVTSNKRYSVESHESIGSVVISENGSAGSSGSGSASDSVNGNAVAPSSAPSTPTKSRLPAFLQHRRTESGTSIISSDGQVSPARSLTFFRDAIAGMRTPESQLDNACPVLRVIPPTIESDSIPTVPIKGRNNKRMSSGPALMQAMMEEPEHVSLSGDETAQIPMITCTPATAAGSATASPLAMLEAEVRRQRNGDGGAGGVEPVFRAERGQTMISALGRRSRAGPE